MPKLRLPLMTPDWEWLWYRAEFYFRWLTVSDINVFRVTKSGYFVPRLLTIGFDSTPSWV